MKCKKFPVIIIALSCALLTICGAVYFGIARTSENGGETAYEDYMQRQWNLKEIEVQQALCDYDKENIQKVLVSVQTSDNGIASANILVVSKNKIADEDEQKAIKDIASGLLDLNAQNISVQNLNMEYEDNGIF